MSTDTIRGLRKRRGAAAFNYLSGVLGKNAFWVVQ